MSSLKITALVLLAGLGNAAHASSDPHEYTLPWKTKGEVLKYRSCGCADSCWIAELRKRESRQLKATLRCNCEDLLITYPAKSAERKLGKSCAVINDRTDKMEAISEQMSEIVNEGAQ